MTFIAYNAKSGKIATFKAIEDAAKHAAGRTRIYTICPKTGDVRNGTRSLGYVAITK